MRPRYVSNARRDTYTSRFRFQFMRTLTRRVNPRGGVAWNVRSFARSLARACGEAERSGRRVASRIGAGAREERARTEDDELARRQAASVAWQRPHLASLPLPPGATSTHWHTHTHNSPVCAPTAHTCRMHCTTRLCVMIFSFSLPHFTHIHLLSLSFSLSLFLVPVIVVTLVDRSRGRRRLRRYWSREMVPWTAADAADVADAVCAR